MSFSVSYTNANRMYWGLSLLMAACISSSFLLKTTALVYIPFAILAGLFVLFYDIKVLYFLLLFFIPFSIEYSVTDSLSTDLPDEPMMVALAGCVVLYMLYQPALVKKFVSHPLMQILFLHLIWSIPTLLLVFAITLALGKGFWQVFIAVGLTMWVSVARLIRGQVLSLREMEYIEAAKALGYSNARIIIRHILPNVMGPVIVIAASNFATAIVIEAGLSFLGVGVQAPQPSWGLMIKENYNFIITHNPFLAIAPGIAIMILVLAFNLLGNGLRDALDVKGKL